MSVPWQPEGWARLQTQKRTIVFADLVESVRLMRRHETDAIDRWRRFATKVREETVPAHRGRVVRTAGDGLLIEFGQVHDAVAAALALHGVISLFNDGHSAEDAMLLRIGLHEAEVLLEEHEAYGAGVNLAARLAGLAAPTQTACSAEVRHALVDGVHAAVEDLGDRYLKHFDEPVRAFLLHPPGATRSALQAPTATQRGLRPTIAVVPFAAMPTHPEHDALGHAMADDIIAALSRRPDLCVLSRHSTAALSGGSLAPSRVHELVGATYLLTGRYYVHGSRVRLAAELCAVPAGNVLWAGGAVAQIDALFVGQDELVPHVVAQISQTVLAYELSRTRSLPMTSLASYTLYLGATGLMNSLARTDFALAHEVLEHLAERHPRQAAPQAMLAHWHLFRLVQAWAEDAAAEARRARERAQRALDIDAEFPAALVASGTACDMLDHDAAGARRWLEAALALDPNDPHAWAQHAGVLSTAGLHAEALASAQRAIELSPLDPRRYLFDSYAARAALRGGRFAEAAAHARDSVRRNLLHAPSHRLLVASLWHNDEAEAARAAATRYLQLFPAARASGPLSPAAGPATLVTEALHAAGVPR